MTLAYAYFHQWICADGSDCLYFTSRTVVGSGCPLRGLYRNDEKGASKLTVVLIDTTSHKKNMERNQVLAYAVIFAAALLGLRFTL